MEENNENRQNNKTEQEKIWSEYEQDQFDNRSGAGSEGNTSMIDTESDNQEEATNNQNNEQKWQTITSKPKHAILLSLDEAIGKTLQGKKAWIFNLCAKVPGFVGLKAPSPKHKSKFKIEFATTEAKNNGKNCFYEKNITTEEYTPELPEDQHNNLSGIAIRDIPIGITIEEIKASAATIGTIKNISISLKGGWQTAIIKFKEKDEELNINETWSINIRKDNCRVIPQKTYKETANSQDKYCAKLTNLPPGCSAFELEGMLKEINAKSCFIPRTRVKYNRMGIAFIAFESKTEQEKAMDTKYEL